MTLPSSGDELDGVVIPLRCSGPFAGGGGPGVGPEVAPGEDRGRAPGVDEDRRVSPREAPATSVGDQRRRALPRVDRIEDESLRAREQLDGFLALRARSAV